MADVIGIAASAVGLLGAVYDIIIKIHGAKTKVDDLPELLKNHAREVASIKTLLGFVQSEPSMKTPNIQDTVKDIRNSAQSLHAFLAAQKTTLNKGHVQNYLRQLFKGPADQTRLDEIMGGLLRAKQDLTVKICLVNAGLVRGSRNEMRVQTEILKKLDGRIKAVLGRDHGLKLAERVKGRPQIGRGIAALEFDDIVAMASSPHVIAALSYTDAIQPGSAAKVRVVTNNTALKRALQVNTPVGQDNWANMNVIVVDGNVSKMGAVQFNGPIGSSDFLGALQITHGRA